MNIVFLISYIPNPQKFDGLHCVKLTNGHNGPCPGALISFQTEPVEHVTTAEMSITTYRRQALQVAGQQWNRLVDRQRALPQKFKRKTSRSEQRPFALRSSFVHMRVVSNHLLLLFVVDDSTLACSCAPQPQNVGRFPGCDASR